VNPPEGGVAYRNYKDYNMPKWTMQDIKNQQNMLEKKSQKETGENPQETA
jgi:phage pi2 protein 07